MALAVCLLFDSRTDLLVRQLWSRLEAAGVGTMASHTHGRHHPHLSYAVLREWELDAVLEEVTALPDAGPVTARCHGILHFSRGRIALAPAVSTDVLIRQEAVVRAVDRAWADLHRHYWPGHWLPHISVVTRCRADQLTTANTMVSDVLPLEIVAPRAALIDSATGQLWHLPHVP